jgi:putative restriction endonuclease
MLIAAHLRRLSDNGGLTSSDLLLGVEVDGERIPVVNPQRGIFKPKQMRHLLSIRTVYPKSGARIWYDDQREVHAQIEAGEEVIDYAFQGSNPEAFDNQWLLRALQAQVPFIYFLGIAPSRYTAYFPTFVVDWNAGALKAGIAFGTPLNIADSTTTTPDVAERRYALRLVRQRLHQARFREAVLSAYGNRCAVSGLPESRLLDAAHIIADLEEKGQPIVPNGLPLSKVHHAAFDANLIGIDPDFKIHVAESLLSIDDGPMFEQGVKKRHGEKIRLPDRTVDFPDRDRLAERFAQFQASTH